MTSFYDTLKTYDWDDVKQNIMDKSKNDAIAAINNPIENTEFIRFFILPDIIIFNKFYSILNTIICQELI